MRIWSAKGHDIKDGMDYAWEDEKTEYIEDMSVVELIQRLQAFVEEHPKAYILQGSDLVLEERHEEFNGSYNISFTV